ncbi:Protein wntless-like protein [Acropora cervicornis]|uniref:Protein wntless-like protein n=1 Tax=Acropora cervicornis TaxID=6130 RepID=A0AAD9Q8K3_ACRCE|nr:Protein wntless-like protein [Acropora cervicornis]
MAVILETLRLRSLLAFALLLVAILITFFVVGGKIAPAPTTATSHIANICVANLTKMDAILDPETCNRIDSIKDAESDPRQIRADQIVFTIRFPHQGLSMSRWFQFVATSIRLDLEHDPEFHYRKNADGSPPSLSFKATLAYRNKQGPDSHDWQSMYTSLQERPLVCEFVQSQSDSNDGYYNCEDIPFFEIGNVYYEEYLVNVRLPSLVKNNQIGKITDINFVEIHQNGGFTKVWFTLKTVVAPVSILILIWFAQRVKKLRRDSLLLEKALFCLGVVTAFMNYIRQGLFYGMLMSFWVIFAGEHLVDQPERNNLKSYWKQVGAIGFGCLSLLIFDLSERVFWNIRGKRAAIPTMSRARQLQYRGLIYRFEFLLVVTILCAGLTVVFFVISSVNEAQWKFGEEESTVEISSALFTGIYGMWNVYVFSLVILYAPSSAAPITDDGSDENERLELRSRTEVRVSAGETEESVVYQFTGKSARD